MAWCRPSIKPLSEPVMVRSRRYICVIRPQWVNTSNYVTGKAFFIHPNECVKMAPSKDNIDDLVQDYSKPIANALELLQYYTKPSICSCLYDKIVMCCWRKEEGNLNTKHQTTFPGISQMSVEEESHGSRKQAYHKQIYLCVQCV